MKSTIIYGFLFTLQMCNCLEVTRTEYEILNTLEVLRYISVKVNNTLIQMNNHKAENIKRFEKTLQETRDMNILTEYEKGAQGNIDKYLSTQNKNLTRAINACKEQETKSIQSFASGINETTNKLQELVASSKPALDKLFSDVVRDVNAWKEQTDKETAGCLVAKWEDERKLVCLQQHADSTRRMMVTVIEKMRLATVESDEKIEMQSYVLWDQHRDIRNRRESYIPEEFQKCFEKERNNT